MFYKQNITAKDVLNFIYNNNLIDYFPNAAIF